MAQDSRQAGAIEIEVTSAMIEAGRDVYFELDNDEVVSSEIVMRIFEAMLAANFKQTFELSLPPRLEIA